MADTEHPAPDAIPCAFTLTDGRTCRLRSLVEQDAEACCTLLPKLHAETDFLNWMAGEFNLTVEQERAFIRSRMEDDRSITLAAEMDGVIVGLAGAWSREFNRFQHHAELGVSILRAYWGLGIGGHMMQHLFAWAFRRGLHKMYLCVHAANKRAYEWYLSLGFIEEGRLKNYVRRADGSFDDVFIMARNCT